MYSSRTPCTRSVIRGLGLRRVRIAEPCDGATRGERPVNGQRAQFEERRTGPCSNHQRPQEMETSGLVHSRTTDGGLGGTQRLQELEFKKERRPQLYIVPRYLRLSQVSYGRGVAV